MTSITPSSPAGTARRPTHIAAWCAAGALVAMTIHLGLQGWALRQALHRGRRLAAQARPFEARPARRSARVLVLGDSTGVGVGAGRAEDSLPGLLAAAYPRVEVVNRCRNGARVGDAAAQIAPLAAAGERFDLVLVLAGGNDVLWHTPLRRLRTDADALLHALSVVTPRAVWLGSANLGSSPLLRAPLAWWLARRTRRTMALLAERARAHDVAFVDFFRARRHDLFARDAARYFADDGLHPSAASYRHGFETLEQQAPLHDVLRTPPGRQTLPTPAPARLSARAGDGGRERGWGG